MSRSYNRHTNVWGQPTCFFLQDVMEKLEGTLCQPNINLLLIKQSIQI